MLFITDFALENYVLNTKWIDIPSDIQERVVRCSIDLMGALVLGSRGNQYDIGVRVAKRIGATGNIPILGRQETFNLLGASIAFSHAANSFDIDDGYNMIKGHPGASFVSGVLAAALERNCSYREYLTTLAICYEVTIRWAFAEQKHYKFLHSTGTYGAFGTVVGIGRLHKMDMEHLNNALSIADYHAPLTPVMRAVEYPSMNKDGVPFGSLVGTMAIIETEEGEIGKTHLLEMPEYREYLDSLGKKYYIRDLYFKPYTCCRWAHQPIKACLDLMRRHNIEHTQIKQVIVHTFASATKLSKAIPHNTDEAQYNIAYPIAAAIVHGDVGFKQVHETALNDETTVSMMKKLSFVLDSDIEQKFPEKRLAWVEMQLKDGEILRSAIYDAPGECTDSNLSLDWIVEKFKRITAPITKAGGQKAIIDSLASVSDVAMQEILAIINQNLGN